MTKHLPLLALTSGDPVLEATHGGLDAGDLNVVTVAFTFAAVTVLCAALGLDVAILWVLQSTAGSLEGIPAHHLAFDALPWALIFTGIAGVLALFGLRCSIATNRIAMRSVPVAASPRFFSARFQAAAVSAG